MKYKNHLIIGGAGFIGMNLAVFLKKKGSNVRVLDNFSNTSSNNISVLKECEVELIKGEGLISSEVMKAMDGQDVVYNFASSPIIDDGFVSSESLTVSQVISTQVVIGAASNFDVKEIIVPSSLHVYGNPSTYRKPVKEDDSLNPINSIGAVNKCVETIAKTFSEAYKQKVTVVRIGEVFGPGMNVFSTIFSMASIARDVLNNYPPLIPSDGEHSLDFTYIDDVVKYLYEIVESDPENLFEVYNLCSGKSRKINEIVERILKYFEKEKLDNQIIHDKVLWPYVFHLSGNNEKIIEKFGNHFSDFEDNILETFSWIKKVVELNLPPIT